MTDNTTDDFSSANDPTDEPTSEPNDALDTPSAEGDADAPVKKKRAPRKRRSTKKAATKPDADKDESPEGEAADASDSEGESESQSDEEDAPKPKRKRSRRKKTTAKAPTEADESGEAPEGEASESDESVEGDSDESPEPTKKKRSRSRKKTSTKASDKGDDEGEERDEKAEKPRSRRGSSRSKSGDEKPEKSAKPDGPPPHVEMVINYAAGEECRVAMVENGQLEELYAEPTDQVSRVGNIYVGKVVNVEPAIQAAFVDFGVEDNGFLHISDLHPQFFGEDDAIERVGKKTPRRERPPIQEALKRGQEITVQVLKEGVGTKGPSLTSYLSIPGRFLVMMPGMDKVGVSRKEEDDDRRKAARDILNQLELPDGFGFILRTAGFDRNKTELKRDLSYLTRLWKDMERRRKGGNKPRPLYSESDLLLRSIRDLMSTEVSRVVIDSEPALRRAAQFMKIAAPRSQAKLAHYTGTAPIFHAFGVEEQIEAIHSREVMLPSGGRLIFDQTEALVAIDVNSGKSRSARDAETNAFRTNMEAADAICRQLRLRDQGGLVVNDLIDMRYASHRKQVENRFKERLKRDRAKTTVGPISQFGLLEMTRQRMRGSMESQHFSGCPTCRGRGLVQKPDSVAATALRDLAALGDREKVKRIELVVNPHVAGALLSHRRAALTRIELTSGKQIDVRVSESIPIDRVSFYAYDKSGSDIDLDKLLGKKGREKPRVVDWIVEGADESWAVDPSVEADETTAQKLADEIARLAEQAEERDQPLLGEGLEGEIRPDDETGEGGGKKKRRRRRRRRGGRGEGEGNEESGEQSARAAESSEEAPPQSEATAEGDGAGEESDEGTGKKKRRRRRRRRGGGGGDGEQSESNGQADGQSNAPSEDASSETDSSDAASSEAEAKPKRRSRSRGTKKTEEVAAEEAPPAEPETKPVRRRGLYSSSRRKLAPSEIGNISKD